jgi:hypothetical protein
VSRRSKLANRKQTAKRDKRALSLEQNLSSARGDTKKKQSSSSSLSFIRCRDGTDRREEAFLLLSFALALHILYPQSKTADRVDHLQTTALRSIEEFTEILRLQSLKMDHHGRREPVHVWVKIGRGMNHCVKPRLHETSHFRCYDGDHGLVLLLSHRLVFLSSSCPLYFVPRGCCHCNRR